MSVNMQSSVLGKLVAILIPEHAQPLVFLAGHLSSNVCGIWYVFFNLLEWFQTLAAIQVSVAGSCTSSYYCVNLCASRSL